MKLSKKILGILSLSGLLFLPSTVHAGQLNELPDLSEQLELITNLSYEWIDEDSCFSWQGYTVTDLDGNGRIEIVRNLLGGSALFSTNDLWEVNSSRTGLVHVPDKSEFDLGSSEQIVAYHDSLNNRYYYMCVDGGRFAMRYAYSAKGSLSYKNEIVTSQILATCEMDHQEHITAYIDGNENIISKDVFDNIGDLTYGNYDKCSVSLKWVRGPLSYDNLYQILSDAANSFDVVKLHEPGWFLEDGIWRYYDADGTMASGWRLINNNWYFFNGDGVMLSGWQIIDGTWYYFDYGGNMLTGWQDINGIWYYFNDSGAMLTGWQVINGNWFYFNYSGAMLTGWQDIDGIWYYFNDSGAMLTGWQDIDGTWYYFDYGGNMLTGWQVINGNWFYFNYSGAMLTGWQDIYGVWYFFNSSGAMLTGWQNIYGTWYYFYPNGAMASNTWIGNCYVNGSGAWV